MCDERAMEHFIGAKLLSENILWGFQHGHFKEENLIMYLWEHSCPAWWSPGGCTDHQPCGVIRHFFTRPNTEELFCQKTNRTLSQLDGNTNGYHQAICSVTALVLCTNKPYLYNISIITPRLTSTSKQVSASNGSCVKLNGSCTPRGAPDALSQC